MGEREWSGSMETLWNCRMTLTASPALPCGHLSESDVIEPGHTNALKDGCWMLSDDHEAAGKVSTLTKDQPLTTEGKNQSLTSPQLIISRVMKSYFLCRHSQFLRNSFPIRVSDSFRKWRPLFSLLSAPLFPSLLPNHTPYPSGKIWYGSACAHTG